MRTKQTENKEPPRGGLILKSHKKYALDKYDGTYREDKHSGEAKAAVLQWVHGQPGLLKVTILKKPKGTRVTSLKKRKYN